MRFRDFVYEFQRKAKTKVDDRTRDYLSDAYNRLTGLPEDQQMASIDLYAQFFLEGERRILGILEKKMADQAKSKRSA